MKTTSVEVSTATTEPNPWECVPSSVSMATESDCVSAASTLGLTWRKADAFNNRPNGCIKNSVGKVFFNTAQGRANAKYEQVCLPCVKAPADEVTGDKKNVLLVIDMQRDYCIGDACGEPVSTVSKWASDKTTTVVQPIVDLMDKNVYDLVVFTQDSLSEGEVCVENPNGEDWVNGSCVLGSSLVTGSPGWEVIHALTDAAKAEFGESKIIFYTKHTDDALNILDGSYQELDVFADGACYPTPQEDRKFDVVGDYNQPLAEVLRSRGFGIKNANIHAVGVLGNRCVMKSALHAKYLGYDVTVIKSAVGVAEDAENWYINEDEKLLGGTGHWLAEEPCTQNPCPEAWYQNMYAGYRGGPAGDMVWPYLESGQINLVDA